MSISGSSSIDVGGVGGCSIDPDNIRSRSQGPSLAHPFGTDQLGRDYLSRLFWGARISLLIGFAAMLISGVIGTAIAAHAATTALSRARKKPGEYTTSDQ